MSLWGNTDTVGDEPKFAAHHEGMDSSNFTVFGVDETELGNAANTQYAVSHEGWVGITTYNDMNGNLRVKSEVLVALNIASGDQANDDTIYTP